MQNTSDLSVPKRNIFKKYKKVFYIFLILIVVFLFFFLKNKNNEEQTVIAKIGDFKNQVSVSGKVVPSSSVDLSFKNSGRIERIYFDVSNLAQKRQIVQSGTIIAELDSSVARKDVHDAEISLANAKLALSKLTLENSDENLNINLQKAYDDGFIEVSDTFLDLPNTITGLDNILSSSSVSDNTVRNSGNTALDYKNQAQLLYYKSKSSFEENRKNFRSLNRNSSKEDIEKIINETYDTTKVLMDAIKSTKNLVDYLSEDTGLPENYTSAQSTLYSYTNSINSHLTSLLSIKNSIKNYKDAFSTTDLDVQSLKLSITQKENALEDAKSKLGDYYIRAPFSGIITKIDAKVGEMAIQNTPLVSMMSDGTFQIESFVPEVSISQLIVGQEADITLDAYGEKVLFKAKVISIDPAETIRDGVSTYKVKFQFVEKDERIKSGMTASVVITTSNKSGVIVLPEGVIFEKDGKKFVQIKNMEKIDNVEIVVGSRSQLGQVEITSGVKDGDIVLLNPKLN